MRIPRTNRSNNMHRKHVNKHKSARTFKHNTTKTKALNLRGAPMRGGIRL